MIAKIAVSAATYAIDKPYSYRGGEDMTLASGQRVMVPFGRSNRQSEGVVLSVENGNAEKLKFVERTLDDEPVLSENMLRLAAFMRERYFCTFFDAIRVMLPAGLWFQSRKEISLTEDRTWKEKEIKKEFAPEVLTLLENLGGQADESALKNVVPEEAALQEVLQYLLRKKWYFSEVDV